MRRKSPLSAQSSVTQVCAAYIRVSKVGGRGEAGEGEFLSPSLQKEAAMNLARLHGWRFDDELTSRSTDLDVSGRKGNLHKRTGLASLLEAARAGLVQHVIVYKLSRLARSAREGLEIFDMFEQLGVAVHVVKEGIDSSTASGRMIRTMLLGVAEMQSEDISQFSKDAAMQRALQGRVHVVPGWIVKTSDGTYELKPDVAPTIRRLVELRLSGLSYGAIARHLNAEELLTPSGKIWRGNNVSQYLSSDSLRKMHGDSVFGIHLAPGDPGRIELPGVFPALLSETEYLDLVATQQALLGRAVWSEQTDEIHQRKGVRHAPLLSSGLVSCAICNSPMRTIRQSYKTSAGTQAASIVCSGAGELSIAHPTYGRSMAKSEDGTPEQRQMSLASEMVDAAILSALIVLTQRILPSITISEKSIDGSTIGGLSICGKLGYGKSSFFGTPVDGAILENQPYTRARARSSSSSLSISYVLESKTYENLDDDDRLSKTRARTRGREKALRSIDAITADIDDLFGLRSRGRITEGDFDRRYQKLVQEREESARQAQQQEAASQANAGIRMLEKILTGPPDASDEVIAPISLDQWRLTAKLLFEKIEAPLFLPETMVPQTGDHKDRTRRERRALACWLRSPLETGEVVVVAGMYRGAYTGKRYCQLLTKKQFDRFIHRWNAL